MPSDIQSMTQWLHTQSSVGATSGLACLSSIVVILAVILHHFQQRYRSTSFLTSWNGTAVNLRERVALAVTARSPIDRLIEYKRQRGFINLPFVSDPSGEYTRTYVNADDADVPGFSVFMRHNGVEHHFYTGEMSGEMADPGQDPRGAPDLDPLWLMLDLTPNGRGTDWYPKLEYNHR